MKKVSTSLLALVLLGSIASAQDLTNIDFHLKDYEGNERSFQKFLAEVRGGEEAPKKGAIMLSFWALWCQPCLQEMKSLRTFFEENKDKNVHFLAINLDNPRSLAKVKSFISAQNLPYQFWLDPNSEIFKKLNGQSMPYSMILNEQGALKHKRTGFIAGDEKEIADDMLKTLE